MMRFASNCLSLAVLSCLACGQVDQPLGGVTAGGAAGGVSFAGNASGGVGGRGSSAGGSGGTNAIGGSSSGCPAEKPICLESCFNGRVDDTALLCKAGQWQCGSGRTDSKTCPPDSLGGCTGQARFDCQPSCSENRAVSIAQCKNGKFACEAGWVNSSLCPASCKALTALCCFPTGKSEPPPCGLDGPMACPEGSTSVPDHCRPAGIDVVASCTELGGQACASTDLYCADSGSCASDCSCEANASGKLVWVCNYYVC